jgi:hypothetical protein
MFGGRLATSCVVMQYFCVFLLNTRCSFTSSCFVFLYVCPLPDLFLELLEAYGKEGVRVTELS